MRIYRHAFLLLPLLLSACTLPIKETSQEALPSEEKLTDHSKTETPAVSLEPSQDTHKKEATRAPQNPPSDEPGKESLLQQLTQQRTLAEQNINELTTRTGDSIKLPDFNVNQAAQREQLTSQLETLTKLNSTLTAQVIELDKRVEERRKHPTNGDMLQVYLSDLTVKSKTNFKAQPIVGHWLRGETRVVRLNESLLVPNSISEPFYLTYTETYQILINNELIGSFAPDRDKYTLAFDAPTLDHSGLISGTLTIRTQSHQAD